MDAALRVEEEGKQTLKEEELKRQLESDAEEAEAEALRLKQQVRPWSYVCQVCVICVSGKLMCHATSVCVTIIKYCA
jgi:hypothetical protein